MNIPALVRERYKIWSRFLTEQVGFSLQHSQQHTKEHCARVLLFCLLFAQRENLSEQDADALAMAACFHDSRRINDGLDIGHGHRAAKYYCTWCAEHEYVLDARTMLNSLPSSILSRYLSVCGCSSSSRIWLRNHFHDESLILPTEGLPIGQAPRLMQQEKQTSHQRQESCNTFNSSKLQFS